MGVIVGIDGQPLDLEVLQEEIAGPTLAGVRNAWYETIGAGLTPMDMVRILEESASLTDPRPYLTLAEEMEEKDPHYFSVLGSRKLGVETLPLTVTPASDAALDKKISDAVKEMFSLECVASSRQDLLDGLGKGYSATEIKWDRSGAQWMPQTLCHRDPRWFLFDIVDRSTLRLRDESDPIYGMQLPLYKFIVHKPKLKTGLPVRNGLARIIAFTWICKMYALKSWAAFAEVFGMPIRVGKYPATATPRDVQILRRAVANIGTDAAAVMPESMKIEFEQAGNGTGADIFDSLCDYLDKQTSKAVLGQTMTTDEGGGRGKAQASVHHEVKSEILDADGKQLAATYARDLVKGFVDLNFGPQPKYPTISIESKRPEDLEQLTSGLQVLVPLGMRVKADEVRAKYGLSEPQPDDELLQAPVPAPAPDPMDSLPIDVQRAAKALNRATNRMAQIRTPDTTTHQVDKLSTAADPAISSWVDRIRQLLDDSDSLADFRDGLVALYGDMPPAAFTAVMQEAIAAAAAAGRYDIVEQAGGSA